MDMFENYFAIYMFRMNNGNIEILKKVFFISLPFRFSNLGSDYGILRMKCMKKQNVHQVTKPDEVGK